MSCNAYKLSVSEIIFKAGSTVIAIAEAGLLDNEETFKNQKQLYLNQLFVTYAISLMIEMEQETEVSLFQKEVMRYLDFITEKVKER